MAAIYSTQFTVIPLGDALDGACETLSISSLDLQEYYPSYYHLVFDQHDTCNLYLVLYRNSSIYTRKVRTYFAVLPFRSISCYVTPFGEISPCLSESQLRRFALIVRCCHYRYYWHVNKTFVYNPLCSLGVNLERSL